MDWFADRLLAWFELYGRKNLPWQDNINPYRVWVSEIMLQQTQVATVVDYYQRFMQRFPDVHSLAAAETDQVLHLWTGLGYYARGRNLHKAARRIVGHHNGQLPEDQKQLEALAGIGPSTAGAIRAISMGQRGVILDGNVKRVLARFHAVEGHYSLSLVSKKLWQHAEEHTPHTQIGDYTQAIMDLGATLCTRSKPSCKECPLQERCSAFASDRVSELPTKKHNPEKPVRSARFFVLSLQDRRVLLEQRPATGIWGGLWNPPERKSETTVEAFLRSEGIDNELVVNTRPAKGFRHTFSHFHLDIEPIYINLRSEPLLLREGERRWVQMNDKTQSDEPIGLSAAAIKLLAQ